MIGAVVRAALGQDVELVEGQQRAGDAQDQGQRERGPQQRQRHAAEASASASRRRSRRPRRPRPGCACRPDEQEQHVEAGVPPDDQEDRREQRAERRAEELDRLVDQSQLLSGGRRPDRRRVEAVEQQRRRARPSAPGSRKPSGGTPVQRPHSCTSRASPRPSPISRTVAMTVYFERERDRSARTAVAARSRCSCRGSSGPGRRPAAASCRADIRKTSSSGTTKKTATKMAVGSA